MSLYYRRWSNFVIQCSCIKKVLLIFNIKVSYYEKMMIEFNKSRYNAVLLLMNIVVVTRILLDINSANFIFEVFKLKKLRYWTQLEDSIYNRRCCFAMGFLYSKSDHYNILCQIYMHVFTFGYQNFYFKYALFKLVY